MLTNKDYFHLGAKGVYVVCEMDTEYNHRTKRLVSANPTGDSYSVAKVFTVTAIGMCVDRGLLKTTDRILEVLDIALPHGCDEKWREVTIHTLLKHCWGLGKSGLLDIDADNASLYPSEDYLSMVLETPLPKEQEADFCYSDAAYYLLSLAVEKVSGQTLFAFLREPLMGVMRFGEYAWSCCPKGHTMGATGLFLRCEDMVKPGVLYLNGGLWQGKRIISEEWCRTVLEQGYELSPLNGGWFCKVGMYGQMLAINPEKQLSIACMGHSRRFSPTDILE